MLITEANSAFEKELVIVAGGTLGDWVLTHLKSGCFLVGADRGAWFLIQNGYKPDVALGDFDSVTEEERENIRRGSGIFLDCDPVRKDLTDTEWALDWALAARPASILLLGATGTRFDHTFANVQLLKKAADAGVPCRLADEHNEIFLLAGPGSLTLTKRKDEVVSLLPLSGAAQGITLEGFRYPLRDASLEIGQTLGISNVVEEDNATVSLRQGLLLVIQSRD